MAFWQELFSQTQPRYMLAPVVQVDCVSPMQSPVENDHVLGHAFKMPEKEIPETKSLKVLGGIITLILEPAGIEVEKENVVLGVAELDTEISLMISPEVFNEL